MKSPMEFDDGKAPNSEEASPERTKAEIALTTPETPSIPNLAISTVVLMMELTGRYRSFILPLLLVVGIATLVARTIEPRSIYDARLIDEEVEARQKLREATSQ